MPTPQAADRFGLAELLRLGTDFHRLASLLVDQKPITQRIRQLDDHQVAAVIPARWVIRAHRDRHELLFLRYRHPILISVAGVDLEYERPVTTEFSIDDFSISSSATTEHHCARGHHRSESNGRATRDHPDKIARLPSSATAKASAERQFWLRDVRIYIRAMLGGVNRRATVWIQFVGFVIVAAIAVRSPLFGSYGPVNESQCVRVEDAAVCVDRRGSELEVRADGLRPGSSLRFDGESLPVSPSGGIEGRWFFETNEHTLRGPIFIEARAASGTSFAGTVEFWERT